MVLREPQPQQHHQQHPAMPLSVHCFKTDESAAAVLDSEVLEPLVRRRELLPAVDDFWELHRRGRDALLQVAFDIPKIIHQVRHL